MENPLQEEFKSSDVAMQVEKWRLGEKSLPGAKKGIKSVCHQACECMCGFSFLHLAKKRCSLLSFLEKKILTITKQSHYCDSCLYKVRRGVRSPHFRARAFSQEYKRQISLSWESYLVKMAEEGEKGAVWQVDRIEWTWPRGMDLSAIDLVTNGVWRAWHRRSVSEDLTIPALSPGLSNSQ
jgi:hypothetical protein